MSKRRRVEFVVRKRPKIGVVTLLDSFRLDSNKRLDETRSGRGCVRLIEPCSIEVTEGTGSCQVKHVRLNVCEADAYCNEDRANKNSCSTHHLYSLKRPKKTIQSRRLECHSGELDYRFPIVPILPQLSTGFHIFFIYCCMR